MGSEIVELSPQPMHKACRSWRRQNGGVHVSCHLPFSELLPDSLLVTWTDAGGVWNLKRAPGKRIKLDGIAGRWDVRSVADSHLPLSATETISVAAPIPGESRGNYLSLYVELRGPHTAGMVRQVRSMVRSMRWSEAS